MSKLLKKEVQAMLTESEHLRDAKIEALVTHLYNKGEIQLFEMDRWIRILTKHNPESFCREWRKTQEENKELRGKNYDKRHRQANEVSKQIIEEKHNEDIFDIMPQVVRLIPAGGDRYMD